MNISVCITTFNEEKTVAKLLESLIHQSRLPNEIVVVDGGSTDSTTSKIFNFQFLNKITNSQKRIVNQYPNINFQLIENKQRISIARGRNIAVKNAKYPIIAMTDAGCVCEKHWLERITEPFEKPERDTSTPKTPLSMTTTTPDVAAGFYTMAGKSDFQKALKPFLGIMPDKFDERTFLPSTRSIAFRKSLWEKVGGFDEKFDRASEDYDFSLKISNFKFQIARRKDACVYWEVPDNLFSAMKKFFYYARGDAQSRRWSKHNIHSLSVILRYLILGYWRFLIPLYLIWAVWKHHKYLANWRQRVYTVIIQVASDISVMAGFLDGLF